jgi:hypothetical protein
MLSLAEEVMHRLVPVVAVEDTFWQSIRNMTVFQVRRLGLVHGPNLCRSRLDVESRVYV